MCNRIPTKQDLNVKYDTLLIISFRKNAKITVFLQRYYNSLPKYLRGMRDVETTQISIIYYQDRTASLIDQITLSDAKTSL